MIYSLIKMASTLAKYFRPLKKIAAVVLLAVFLAGCWDSVDINERLIATTSAFDLVDGEIWFQLEFVNIKPGKAMEAVGEAMPNKYIIYRGHGKTLTEARDAINLQMDEPPYLSGVVVILFTEDFADEHLVEYLLRFRADETYRKKVYSAIIKEKPEELYDSVHKKNISLGLQVERILDTLSDTDKSFHSRITMRLLENICSRYAGILLPCIGIKHGEIALAGYSAIDKTGVIGFIPAEESRAIVFLKADKARYEIVVPYNGINFTAEVKLAKRKIAAYYENGKAGFDVKTHFKARLLYGDKITPYNLNEDDVRKISETLAEILKKEMSEAISRAQTEFECDYFQFDDEFRIKYPAEFEKMDWKKEFTGASVNVDAKVDMLAYCNIDYTFGEVK
jgi:Ger(x)C family germination protein